MLLESSRCWAGRVELAHEAPSGQAPQKKAPRWRWGARLLLASGRQPGVQRRAKVPPIRMPAQWPEAQPRRPSAGEGCLKFQGGMHPEGAALRGQRGQERMQQESCTELLRPWNVAGVSAHRPSARRAAHASLQ